MPHKKSKKKLYLSATNNHGLFLLRILFFTDLKYGKTMRRITSGKRFITVIKLLSLCALSLGMISLPTFAASSDPTSNEQRVLDQYPSYSGYIHFYDSNRENNIHQFLSKNVGKTVFLDTSILRYAPLSPMVKTDTDRARIPTDRWDNATYNNCTLDQEEIQSFADHGIKGFPLPASEEDIERGCDTRIRFKLEWGDSSPGFMFFPGRNKVELVFSTFFDVSKETLEDEKTLYVLTQKEVPEETRLIFEKYVRDDTRELRQISLPDHEPPQE